MAGETSNTVPGHAEASVDVRVPTAADQERLDAEIRSLAGIDSDGVTATVHGGPNRPPLEPSASAPLLPHIQDAAERPGMEPPESVAVGGVSDGNITATLGVPTLTGPARSVEAPTPRMNGSMCRRRSTGSR